MLNKLVDVLKEVFWIKPRRSGAGRRKKPKSSRKAKPAAKKKAVKKKTAKKAVKAAAKPKAQKGTVPLKSRGQSPAKAVKAAINALDPSLVEVGVITHYFDRIKVCVVKLTQGTVLIGDKLTIAGPKTKFVQKVWSMQIESQDVKVAKKGQLIGLKVDKLVAVGDKVYK